MLWNEIAFPDTGKSNEWYTPSKYIEAARSVMGSIDLDPASCELANRTVCASNYYTKEQNGLVLPWYGNVWLNPPFGRQNPSETDHGGGKSLIQLYISKLITEYKKGNINEAVLLTMPKTDTAWFQPLWEFPICCADHRVLFIRPKGLEAGQMFGTCFVYLGPNEQAFITHFSPFGRIVRAIDTPPERHRQETFGSATIERA
jgi:DNA N-6-adenine-methyltransferase (Dam)